MVARDWPVLVSRGLLLARYHRLDIMYILSCSSNEANEYLALHLIGKGC